MRCSTNFNIYTFTNHADKVRSKLKDSVSYKNSWFVREFLKCGPFDIVIFLLKIFSSTLLISKASQSVTGGFWLVLTKTCFDERFSVEFVANIVFLNLLF